jgi:tryptophanyl-tRNA synthetase
MIIVSGIQSSGELHLGNYFGAIQHQIELQHRGDVYYFIADYHALTSLHDAAKLREYSQTIACAYLALGLDPNKATLFRQSDVPEVTELSWILSTVTPYGLMARSHAFKDKVDKGLSPNIGLFTYPVLMAADILLYGADLVPVGPDQVQHVEIAQDIAASFNHAFKTEILKRPEIQLSVHGKVPGLDSQKMAKSRGNVIPLFVLGKALQKHTGAILTDTKDFTKESLTPEDTICKLYDLFATDEEKAALRQNYRDNRAFGYGHAKQLLKNKIEEYFAKPTEKYLYYKAHLAEVEDILKQGQQKARSRAKATLNEVRLAVGLPGDNTK